MMKKLILGSFLAALVGVFCLGTTALAQIDNDLKQTLQTTTDEAVLINALKQGGDEPADIFRNNLACKRLAIFGTEAAVDELAKLLGDAKQNHNARYALEVIPGSKVDATLQKAAKDLTGLNAAGVIATIGNRRDVSAVGTLKGLLSTNDPIVKKAVFAALGFIANEETAEILLAQLNSGKGDNNFTVWTGLADALLDSAETFEKEGNTPKALEIYDAVVNPSFPVFAQKAGAYRGLLARSADSATTIVDKLHSPNECCFTGGIKTIREYKDADAPAIVAAVIAEIPKLNDERKVLAIRAVGDRTDLASMKLVFPMLVKQGKAGTPAVKVAVLQAFKNIAPIDFKAFLDFVMNDLQPDSDPVQSVLVDTAIVLDTPLIDEVLADFFSHVDDFGLDPEPGSDGEVGMKNILRLVEERRTKAVAPQLLTIINAKKVTAPIREAALAALSETVTLDNLGLLVKALETEADEAKVDWILRAACTRLPREDCAAAVVKIFDAATAAEKIKLMGLLKQIGGKNALACIAKACWSPETVDDASRILGEWNTPEDINEMAAACLKLAKEATDNKYRVRGIRSYIRIPRQFDMPLEQRIAMCRAAFDAATRADDKVLIFDVLARQTEVPAVAAALSYANDSNFKDNACSTAVAVAEKINLAKPGWDWKTSDPDEDRQREEARVVAVSTLTKLMKDVQALSGDQNIKNRAQNVIDRLK